MQTELLIDNQARAASSNATFERLHPTSGDVVTRAAAGTVQDAVAAADSASLAYQSWKNSPPSERRRILLKAADALEARVGAFIEAMAAEVGASALWAGFNVHLAANLFREAASLATQIQGETIPTDKPGTLSMTVRQPVGVQCHQHIGDDASDPDQAWTLAARPTWRCCFLSHLVSTRSRTIQPRRHRAHARQVARRHSYSAPWRGYR